MKHHSYFFFQFYESAWPIKTKLLTEYPWEVVKKFCINGRMGWKTLKQINKMIKDVCLYKTFDARGLIALDPGLYK